MRLLLATLLLIQVAPAQSEADKLEAALKKFGDRTYKILAFGGGSMSKTSRVESDGGRKIAVFEEIIRMAGMGKGESMTQTGKCSLEGFRLLSAKRIHTTSAGSEVQWELSVMDRKVKIISGKKRRVENLDISERTVGELGLMRLLCAAEQKIGSSFKVDVLFAGMGRFQPALQLRCVSREQIEIQGKKVDAFKWEETPEESAPKGADVPVPPT